MPDIQALIRHINRNRVEADYGSVYTLSRENQLNIQDTFFALACLKTSNADSLGGEIFRFLTSHNGFDFSIAYYAMTCLRLGGAGVAFQDGMIRWSYGGDKQTRPCAISSINLLHYLKYEIRKRQVSSIFSSSLSRVFKRIELGVDQISNGLVHKIRGFVKIDSRLDLISIYMALETLKSMEMKEYTVKLSSYYIEKISAFLRLCTTRDGYVVNRTLSSLTLESTYDGHKISQYLKSPDPLGIPTFIDSLQNRDGGFRMLPFGGISTLESCCLAMGIIAGSSCEE